MCKYELLDENQGIVIDVPNENIRTGIPHALYHPSRFAVLSWQHGWDWLGAEVPLVSNDDTCCLQFIRCRTHNLHSRNLSTRRVLYAICVRMLASSATMAHSLANRRGHQQHKGAPRIQIQPHFRSRYSTGYPETLC